MDQAGKSEMEKARMSAYGAATTELRNRFEDEFTKLLQVEYDKRNLGQAPLGKQAAKRAREAKAKKELAAKLAKKRQELAELEAAVAQAGIST